ncbi:MAG: phage holin family protein [Ruminococcaceae bacterium]|nr:phage holin family protein [Oscillospiraceae bacterium]
MKGAIKNYILAFFAGMGSILAETFGGWDAFLKALVLFMIVDYITGMTVALVFHKSGKTKNGGASSSVGFKGIAKKICVFLLVALATRVDSMSKTNYVRNATIFFFIANEGLSVIENIGLMGVKYPTFLKKALEALKDKSEEE